MTTPLLELLPGSGYTLSPGQGLRTVLTTWARHSAGFLKRLGAADERGYPRPVRHRAGRSARRGTAPAPGLSGAAPAGGGEAGSREAWPDAPGHGVGP